MVVLKKSLSLREMRYSCGMYKVAVAVDSRIVAREFKLFLKL